MGNFLRSTKCKVILFVLALLIGVMIYAVSMSGYTISSIGFFKSIAVPFQRASNAIAEKVEYVLGIYSTADSYYQENQALKEEIASLNAQLADYDAAKEELEELREFIGIKEDHMDYTMTAPCEVVGYVTNDPYGAFLIEGGTDDGISLYDPVVTVQGLVGMVTEVGKDTATVSTILSPDISVAAYCSSVGEYGVVTGDVAASRDGRCHMNYLDVDTRLHEGNVILTTGDNGYFPENYVIGYVKETGLDSTGLTAYASIEPAADLFNLRMVVVITDFDGKEERNGIEQE